MKKLATILAIILGISIGTNAQITPVPAAADKYAKEFVKAINDLVNEDLSETAFERKCEEIGSRLAAYGETLTYDQTETFIDSFYKGIYYHCAKYGFDREVADMLIASIEETIKEERNTNTQTQSSGTVERKADSYAKQLADIIAEILRGEASDAESEAVGYQIGVYLSNLTPNDVKLFRREFYAALERHIAKIPALSILDDSDIREVVDEIRNEFDPVFSMFY